MSTTTFEPIHVTHFSDELSARTSELLDEEGMLSEAALERLVRRIAARPDLSAAARRRRSRTAAFELLYDDDQVDIWVLSWMPGQKTGFHDHDRSTVALMCVQGELDEGSLTIGTDATLLRMTAGTIRSGPGGYIHSVSHQAGEPASCRGRTSRWSAAAGAGANDSAIMQKSHPCRSMSALDAHQGELDEGSLTIGTDGRDAPPDDGPEPLGSSPGGYIHSVSHEAG